MKTINYKGKGEHSVRELELIIEQQAEELHLFKSGQKQLPINDVVERSEQLKAFGDFAQKRMWEDGDKDLSEFVDEFLSL